MATVKIVLCSMVLLCCLSMGYAKSSIKRYLFGDSSGFHPGGPTPGSGFVYPGSVGGTGGSMPGPGTVIDVPHMSTTDLVEECIRCHCSGHCKGDFIGMHDKEQHYCSQYYDTMECSSHSYGTTCYHSTCTSATHGTCYSVYHVGRQCVCHPGYTGKHCEITGTIAPSTLAPITFAPSTTHAPTTTERTTIAISTPTTSRVTSSTTLPTTMTSSTVPDYCSTFPCGIHGKCTNTGSGYQCTCSPGYTGLNCEVDIDQCVSSPCQNGGSCLDIGLSFVCSCEDGWSGTTCEKDATPACNHRCVLEPVANVHSVPSNGSSNCIDRSKSANEALPMECCGLTKEDTWLKGIQVMPHCSDDTVLPLYTPVASFHNGRPESDTAGVFLGCDANGFKYIKQMCNTTAHIITIPDGTGLDPQSFYVIY